MKRYNRNYSTENSAMMPAGSATIQRKLAVGAANDPLEHQADAMADKVMRMPETQLVQRKPSHSCTDCDDERIHLKPSQGRAASFIQTKDGGGTSSDAASGAIQTTKGGGSPMEKSTKNFMENRFGSDFSDVRIHTGDYASQLSRELNAQAFTAGSDIYFNSGKYSPDCREGKHLLAHELTHVMQQSGPIGRKVQRKEKNGLLGDYTFTNDWNIQFQQNKPSAGEMGASPGAVLTPGGELSLKMIKNALLTSPDLQAELEGNASIEGKGDDNSALSVRRARYIAQQIGWGRVHDVPGKQDACPKLEDGLYGCGTINARKNIDPADRRVRVSLFTPPALTRPAFGSIAPPPVTLFNPARPPENNIPAQPGALATGEKEESGSNQFGGSIGGGYLGHHYLTAYGTDDPLNEAIIQVLLAYTRQFHKDGQSGFEVQTPLQFQVSLTTGVVTAATGVQLSYVWPFARDKSKDKTPRGQFSLNILQVLVGGPVANYKAPYSASFQIQPGLGAQIGWTPKKWMMLGAQGAANYTWQSNGPQSIDYGGLVFFQFNTP